MANRLNGDAVRWLDALEREGALAHLGDGPLLGRFLAESGEAAEAAFEALVRRHGPMVLSICRGVLRDGHDADDAFQAAFLVLARRASTIRDRDHLAPWLGRVARRIALRRRAEVRRLEAIERRTVADEPAAPPGAPDLVGVETASLVRAEIDRLPDADRHLLHLTYWQGKTYEEAAALLSWPIGTVRSRLSRVRDRLRGRLARLGLAPALAVAGPAISPGEASAARPAETLILRTVRAAGQSVGGMTAAVEAGTVPAAVAALVDGELATMSILSGKSIAAFLVLGGALAAGAGTLGVRGAGARAGEPARPAAVAGPGPQANAASRKADSQKAGRRSFLANGGVEEGEEDSPKGWTAGAPVPGVEYIWSRTGHTGQGSLCLRKTAQRYFPIAEWSQKVDHRGKGPRLKISAWIKADGVTKAILDAKFIGDSRLNRGGSHAWAAYVGARNDGDPPATHGWKRYVGVVEIPPGTRQIIIAAQIYGPGKVWFDDLEAEYTDEPAIDPTRP